MGQESREAALVKHARGTVLSQLNSTFKGSVDPDIGEYLADTVASLFEDDPNITRADFREQLAEIAEAQLEDSGASAADIDAFLDSVVSDTIADDGLQKVRPDATATESADTEAASQLVFIKDLMLMYGGSPVPLLKNTTLDLKRGHRYGIVGTNGSGKTTLMQRLATRGVGSILPENVKAAHLSAANFLHNVNPKSTALQYAKSKTGDDVTDTALQQALRDVGFFDSAESARMMEMEVEKLSGGWQMRLALACALSQKAQLLLLDEPTNHLDHKAKHWLVDFLNRNCGSADSPCDKDSVLAGAAVIISHDSEFLNLVCNDIVHFEDAQLKYHPGNFDSFKAEVLHEDEDQAKLVLNGVEAVRDGDSHFALPMPENNRLFFPQPEKNFLAKVVPETAVLMLSRASFTHGGADTALFENLNLTVKWGSKVGIVGKNGVGKSTLLELMANRRQSNGGQPMYWQHKGLRLVYVAQHSEAQLGDFMKNTPCEYIQLRFKRGYDVEARPTSTFSERQTPSKKEQQRLVEIGKRHGKKGKNIECVVRRYASGANADDTLYEVKWEGLGPADNSFEKLSRFRFLGREYLLDEFNDRMDEAWGEMGERPLEQNEVSRHLLDFGLNEDTFERRIEMLSSGQRSKLLLAASFWTRPHLVCMDEPTNYVDEESVESLKNALRVFKGSAIIVSHHQKFVDEVCDTVWEVCDRQVTESRRLKN